MVNYFFLDLFKTSRLSFTDTNLIATMPKISGADVFEYKDNAWHVDIRSSKEEVITMQVLENGVSNIHIHCKSGTINTLFLHIEAQEKHKLSFTIHLEENAKLAFVSHILQSPESQGTYSFSFQGQKGSDLQFFSVQNTKGQSSLQIQNKMQDNSQCNIHHVSLGKEESKTDIQIQNTAQGAHCKGNIYSRAILFDKSVCWMQGCPEVKQGAQSCEMHLEQKTLLLSKNTHVTSTPLLSVTNNEVIASHSASISTFIPEDLFYLQSRGLTKAQSTRLIVEAFLSEILKNVPSENIRDCLTENAKKFIGK